MSCEVASWIPNVVAATLCADRSAPSVIAWLTAIRDSIEEYDPLVTVGSPSPDIEDPESVSSDSAFDEILSQLGKEIYKLDEYQRNLAPNDKEVSLSILNIFDECLERMTEHESTDASQNDECSDCESTLSDVSFLTSTPGKCVKVTNDINTIFDKGEGTPVPPRRRIKTKSTSSSANDMELQTDMQKLLVSDSDSESTCWSYKECSAEEVNKETYDAVWSHSSGYHNSDNILRRVLLQHHATTSRLSFDTANDLEPADYSVYSLQEVGESRDRCETPVDDMTPDRLTEDGYEPVRDAITDENIYEEIEFGYSYTDEGCSCGTSIEVESCSISASSEGAGRESPLYANLRDHNAYAVPDDVIFWKNLLLHPYYNDDEEDEWITPEECAVYSREQRPPLVIPRITQYRTPRREPKIQIPHTYEEENNQEGVSIKNSLRQYGRLQNWSPTSEKRRADIDRSFKANCDSPPFDRVNKRLGGSTENLLANVRRPNHLHVPESSSGDSLDVEIRDRDPLYARSRKSRSMVAPKQRIRSPVPAPRLLLPHPSSEITRIREGHVKRTKFFEGNKKIKKNWMDFFMILTPTALSFYKFYPTKVGKPPGTPPSPTGLVLELVLALKDARVLQCLPMHTRRHTRSLVLTVAYDQYLIQDETEEGAKKWRQAIEQVIYTLYPTGAECPTPQYQSSNTDLESLGRTPPSSRHANRNKTKAGGSSNEDLSDSTEISIQKSHVRSRLRNFFAKRPAMEVLVKKGIYKDEPVFGRNLEEVCPSTSPRVPDFVVACINEIENKDNIITDGLYRASGNLSQVQKIRLEIDQNNLSVIKNNSDIHVLTGSLKLFFRELKEPLIPCSLFERILAACSKRPREAKIKEFKDIINSLPLCNRDTLKFLLEHLLRVTQYSEQNRMHTANLAIVFGPTLLWAPAEKQHDIAVDCIQQNNVVDILLNEFKDIFQDDNNKSKKKA